MQNPSTPQQSRPSRSAAPTAATRDEIQQQVDIARERAEIARERADLAREQALFRVQGREGVVSVPSRRRLDRRSVTPALGPEVAAQIGRIEQAVDTMAIEVERISEAQRYIAKLQAERLGEPAVGSLPRGRA